MTREQAFSYAFDEWKNKLDISKIGRDCPEARAYVEELLWLLENFPIGGKLFTEGYAPGYDSRMWTLDFTKIGETMWVSHRLGEAERMMTIFDTSSLMTSLLKHDWKRSSIDVDCSLCEQHDELCLRLYVIYKGIKDAILRIWDVDLENCERLPWFVEGYLHIGNDDWKNLSEDEKEDELSDYIGALIDLWIANMPNNTTMVLAKEETEEDGLYIYQKIGESLWKVNFWDRKLNVLENAEQPIMRDDLVSDMLYILVMSETADVIKGIGFNDADLPDDAEGSMLNKMSEYLEDGLV